MRVRQAIQAQSGLKISVKEWPRPTGLRSLTLRSGFSVAKVKVLLPQDLQVLEVPGWTADDVKAGRFHLAEPLPRSLRSVHVTTPLSDLPWLASLPDLAELILENPNADALQAIAKLTGLRSLELKSCQLALNRSAIRQIASLRKLERLILETNRLITEDNADVLSELSTLSSLRRLDLHDIGQAGAANLDSINHLKDLEVLHLGFPRRIMDDQIHELLSGVASLVNLRELTLRGVVTDNVLECFRNLKKIRRLDLSEAAFSTDAGLNALVRTLPEVKTVVWTHRPQVAPRPIEPNKQDAGNADE